MKRVFCIIFCFLMVLSITACNKETAQSSILTDNSNDEAITVKYPVPSTFTFEESENNLGARYTFTLEEFNTMLNSACKELGTTEEDEFFDFSNWTVVSDNLTDENGIKYSSYYYATDTLTISAAVENESGKVMNLGCGTSYEEFANADADYQYTVMLTSAILAMVAGGYTTDDLEFLYAIYFDSAKNTERFYYHNGVYMMNISKGQNDETAALLFMTSPCSEDIKEEWELVDYSEYDGSYKAE